MALVLLTMQSEFNLRVWVWANGLAGCLKLEPQKLFRHLGPGVGFASREEGSLAQAEPQQPGHFLNLKGLIQKGFRLLPSSRTTPIIPAAGRHQGLAGQRGDTPHWLCCVVGALFLLPLCAPLCPCLLGIWLAFYVESWGQLLPPIWVPLITHIIKSHPLVHNLEETTVCFLISFFLK